MLEAGFDRFDFAASPRVSHRSLSGPFGGGDTLERDAVLPDRHNAHYRVRSNFAVLYAAAALAIDYEILPWKKTPTFRAIEKCMRLALATLATGTKEPAATAPAVDAHHVGRALKGRLAKAELVVVKPKQKVTEEQARARRKADGFKINGEIYVEPDRFKRWFPSQAERTSLKEQKVILAGGGHGDHREEDRRYRG